MKFVPLLSDNVSGNNSFTFVTIGFLTKLKLLSITKIFKFKPNSKIIMTGFSGVNCLLITFKCPNDIWIKSELLNRDFALQHFKHIFIFEREKMNVTYWSERRANDRLGLAWLAFLSASSRLFLAWLGFKPSGLFWLHSASSRAKPSQANWLMTGL